jgi:hypothetical protein
VLSRRTIQAIITVLGIAFLAWFSMKFHMDSASDSETEAYVGALIATARHGGIAADAAGQYAALAPYVMWPFTATLQQITGAYQIRGLVFALLILGGALYGTAYAWYRRLGLGWLTSLFGLVVLSTSVAFTMLGDRQADRSGAVPAGRRGRLAPPLPGGVGDCGAGRSQPRNWHIRRSGAPGRARPRAWRTPPGAQAVAALGVRQHLRGRGCFLPLVRSHTQRRGGRRTY